MGGSLTVLSLYSKTNVEVLNSNFFKYDIEDQNYTYTKSKPKNWTKVSELPDTVKWAFLVSEDWAFYMHKGVDLNQVWIVIKESIQEGRLVRGASTISQQVVKNLFLSSEKTIWRKFKELFITFKLENFYPKDKILETYLNLVELGENVYGLGSASRYYFNKDPKDLNVKEATFLSMLLPNPRKYSVSYYNNELTDFAKEQIEKISIKLRQAKIIDEDQRVEEFAKELEFFY